MEPRFRRLTELLRSSLSSRTWAAYCRVWHEWVLALGGEFNIYSPDDRRLTIFAYLFFLAEKGVSGSTVSSALSALSFWFQLLGWEDVTKSFPVRRVVRGWKRVTHLPDTRRPVSIQILLAILSLLPNVCSSEYETLLFRVSFSWAFFGAFCIGELVSKSKLSPGGILWEDVSLSRRSVTIFLQSSKTDCSGRGRRVVLHYCGGPFCPVSLALSFVPLRPLSPTFFVHADSTFLSRFQFLRVFRRCLEILGFPAKEFSTHSFRIGAATAASGLGFTDTELQRLGRWESSRFSLYVRPHLLC